MPPKPAFVSLLWRREGTTPKKFADYYESSYLPLISTLVTLPLIHERSYPIDGNAIILTNRPSEGILSFDSVTAMVFDAQADFEVARNSLADESKRKQVDADEDRFTQKERRVTYFSEVESSKAPEYDRLTAATSALAINVLQISRRRTGIERAQFKSDYEAEISATEAVPGELQHMRYYLLPEHPASFFSGVWGNEPETAMDVIQVITFHSQEAAEQGIRNLQAAALKSDVIDEAAKFILCARGVSEIPNLKVKSTEEQELEAIPQASKNEHHPRKPWVVPAKFDVKEEGEAEWLQIVHGVLDAMRHEGMFISTTICADPSEQGKYMLFEVWKDRDDFFTVQAKREYRHTLMERLPALLRSPVVFEEWTQVRVD